MRKSPTSQTEKALVAYVQGSKADTALESVRVYASGLAGPANAAPESSTLLPAPAAPVVAPPSLIFTASRPEQFNPTCSIYELRLTACLATEIYDEQVTDAEDVHRERLEALRDLLEDLATVQAFVNAPVSGTDSRAITNFCLSGLTYEDEDTRTSDNKIETELFYYVCSSPTD